MPMPQIAIFDISENAFIVALARTFCVLLVDETFQLLKGLMWLCRNGSKPRMDDQAGD